MNFAPREHGAMFGLVTVNYDTCYGTARVSIQNEEFGIIGILFVDAILAIVLSGFYELFKSVTAEPRQLQ